MKVSPGVRAVSVGPKAVPVGSWALLVLTTPTSTMSVVTQEAVPAAQGAQGAVPTRVQPEQALAPTAAQSVRAWPAVPGP
ncbi:MAG: hypothetical protein ACYCTI_01440 [Acidimicrobiales bacterium]